MDVYARIKADILNLKPDFMSILIGVNDVWHEWAFQNGVDTPKFERIYRMLLDEILEALPNIKILLMSPCVLEGGATRATADMPDRWSFFRQGVDEKITAVKRIAADYRLPLLELQPLFDEAAAKTGDPNYWAMDGVHPTQYGHEMIARAWKEAFRNIMH